MSAMTERVLRLGILTRKLALAAEYNKEQGNDERAGKLVAEIFKITSPRVYNAPGFEDHWFDLTADEELYILHRLVVLIPPQRPI